MIGIRQVLPHEAIALRALRLEAVRDEPHAFYTSLEEEQAFSHQEFQARLCRQQDRSFTLVAEDGGRFVGMVGFVREERDKGRHKGFVWGMYVQPAYRGQGIGRRMLQVLLDRAGAQEGLSVVNLEVVTTNTAALSLYSSMGFRRYGTEPASMVVDGETLSSHLLAWRPPATPTPAGRRGTARRKPR